MQGRLVSKWNRKWHNQDMCSCTNQGLSCKWWYRLKWENLLGSEKNVPQQRWRPEKHNIHLEMHQCESQFSPPRESSLFLLSRQYFPGGWTESFLNIYNSSSFIYSENTHLKSHSVLGSIIGPSKFVKNVAYILHFSLAKFFKLKAYLLMSLFACDINSRTQHLDMIWHEVGL